MKYTVVWLPTALRQLADIYNCSADPDAIVRASDRIDQRLRYNPEQQGQPFHGHRMLVQAPLAATFAVSKDDCLVEVLQVSHT